MNDTERSIAFRWVWGLNFISLFPLMMALRRRVRIIRWCWRVLWVPAFAGMMWFVRGCDFVAGWRRFLHEPLAWHATNNPSATPSRLLGIQRVPNPLSRVTRDRGLTTLGFDAWIQFGAMRR